MAAERRERDATDLLVGRAAGLGELTGDAPQLHRGEPGGVGQHNSHLQDDLELVPNGVGREVPERLGAIPGLEHKGTAVGGLGECVLE
jgi:hypothetical protein